MRTPARVVGTILLCVLGTGCMQQKLEREMRKPWSRQTTVLEDAAYTVEVVLAGTGKVVGTIAKVAGTIIVKFFIGMTVKIITFGLVDIYDCDDEDDDDGGGSHRPGAEGGVRDPSYHGSEGRRGRKDDGGRRARGTRRDR